MSQGTVEHQSTVLKRMDLTKGVPGEVRGLPMITDGHVDGHQFVPRPISSKHRRTRAVAVDLSAP